MLKIENLSKSFGGLMAANHVSLDFQAGTLNAVIGPNGAGKTTLFNLITGALRPDTGRILLDGEDIVGLNRAEIVRRGIGRAFQVASIFPSLTVEESLRCAVMVHRRRHGVLARRFPPPETGRQAEEVMAMLGLADKADVRSSNLSHGDQKLLDIALALVLEPRVLLLDEPTAGMGPDERWQMIEKVRRLWEAKRTTLIFIEHDMSIVFRVAQSIRVLCYGAVLAEGGPDEIRGHPEVIKAYLGTEAKGGDA